MDLPNEITQDAPFPYLLDGDDELYQDGELTPVRRRRSPAASPESLIVKILDMTAVVMLGLTLVTGIFAAYQATSWSGESLHIYHDAFLAMASVASADRAADLFDAGHVANVRADRYILSTLFLSVALFLTGLGAAIRPAYLKGMFLGIGVGVWGSAVVYMAMILIGG